MRKWFILFIISILPYVAHADAVQIGSLWYNLDESTMTAEVTSSEGDSYSGDIVIPSTVPYNGTTFSVKSIGANAFYNLSLHSVTIEDGLETIGDFAFWDSDGIYELVLPSTLKTIGEQAFTYAYIPTLVLPEGLISIGPNAFANCPHLQKVVLPSSLTSIGDYVFSGCSKLRSIVSHISSPFEISTNAFSGIYEVTLYVPDGTKSAYQTTTGWDRFADIVEGDPLDATVDGLIYSYNTTTQTAVVTARVGTDKNKLIIPGSVIINEVNYTVKEIGNGAFQNQTSIDTLIIQSGIETIGKNAFQYCYNMKSITLPEGVKTIGENAFQENGTWGSGLKKISLPSSLDSIGNYAFYYCNNLSAVVSKIQTPFNISQSVFASNESYDASGNRVYTYTPSSAILYVPDGTKSTYLATEGWDMFADILEGEPMEATVDDLKYIYVTSSKTAIVVGRAEDSSNNNLTIPSMVPINGEEYSVKAIGNGALRDIGIESLVISSGVETIGKKAFESCWRLKKVDLPSTITSIGDQAFYGMGSLATVISRISSPFEIDKSVFANGQYSHYDESGNYISDYQKSPAILYIPDGTASAYKAIDGWDMFADIVEGELKETTYEGLNYTYVEGKGIATVVGRENTELRKISIPSTIPVDNVDYNVKAIASGAFRDINIDTLIIASGIEEIGKDAFNYCWNLKKVELPSTLKIIADRAFNYCGNLKRIELPSSLDSIGNAAFYSCDNLMFVVSKIQTPFAINTDVFVNNGSKSNAILYVPVGTSSAYKQYDGWNVFSDIIEGEPKEITYEGLIYNYFESNGTATVVGRADDNLTKISIPGVIPIGGSNYSVKTIGAGAFQNCYIDTLVVNDGVEAIENNAFNNCWRLKSVELPTSLKVIGSNSFRNVEELKSIVIPEGVTTIGEGAFRDCDNLQRVDLSSTIDSIGNEAFIYSRNLSSVTSRILNPFAISQSVFCIEYHWDYSGGESKQIFTKSNANLYVPEGTTAKYQQFDGWNMFAAIYEGEIKEYESDSLKYAYLMSNQTATVIASDKYRNYSAITIPGTVIIDGVDYRVTEIGANAFNDCYNLNNVTIEYGVETIGNYAFQYCSNADFSTLPSSIREIGDYAFWNCNKLKNVELPEGLQTLGSAAFGNCYNLQKVILPSTLTNFGERVFESSDNLSSVISHIREPFTISEKVFATNWTWDENNKEVYTPSAATLFVPEGTKAKYEAIPGWTMFAAIYEGELIEQKVGDLYYSYNTSSRFATVVRGDDYSKLTKVEVPSVVELEGVICQVKEIAPRAFSGTPIASLAIEEGLVTIGNEAFANCQQLSTISLPSSLTTLGDAAFRECSRLGSVVIPSGLTTLGYSVFSGCKNLNSLEVAEGNEKFESRGSNAVIERSSNTLVQGCNTTVIPTSVTAIGKEAFIYLDMKAITIPNSVKTIGENAFNSCHNLKEVVLPEGLETLGNTAFHSCSGLTMVELPNSLKDIGSWTFAYCNNLLNVVSNIENPKDIDYNTFGEYNELYSRATLWVPKGKINTYKALEGWNRFKLFDELLRDNLTKPTITYNGRYMTMTNDTTQRAEIYYSVDGSAPTILYRDTIAMSNLGTILAISKRFGSYTVDTTRYEVTYVYDGVTARTASAGLLAKCFEWSGTDKVEMLDIDGTLNDEDFGTIRSLSKLTTLNMAATKMTSGTIPAEAFANTKLQWYVSPYTMTGVGTNIFKGCNQLSAITWNSSSVELPEDVVTDVANPNMLVYAKAQAMIPYSLKNVVVNGYANNIVLADSAGNNNFYCPEEFIARRISYTHNYQQPTLRGTTQGWETLALPFTVGKISHETKGVITPSTVEGAERPFWLYELGDNGLTAATQIRANIPYLICMPNDDAYGDNYILGGRVTFSAQNVTITTSGGTTVSKGNRQFVPTYKAVAKADGVYALNIGEAYNGNPMGSVFVQNYREVRPFEAYSVHSGNRSRTILLSSLGGGDATGINDLMLKNGDDADSVVKVYSLSGALIKQGKREETLRSLPKGLYIIDGKKIIK